jgi:DNA-3-methyladenine glycosylase
MSRGLPRKLKRSFYNRPTIEVARDLLGKVIVYCSPRGRLSARIVEVEAYIGQESDPACHAARGKTLRNEVMFGPPGHAYIYFIYGMYHCLNFVTERSGFPAAVLLRAAEPLEGKSFLTRPESDKNPDRLLAGPGKFCRAFGLTRDQNGLDLAGDHLYLEHRFDRKIAVEQTSRIGISKGKNHLWRFFDRDSTAVSVIRKQLIT